MRAHSHALTHVSPACMHVYVYMRARAHTHTHCPAHLAEQPAPVEPPEHQRDDEKQQQDDGHQAADEDGSRAPLRLGHRLLTPGLQL